MTKPSESIIRYGDLVVGRRYRILEIGNSRPAHHTVGEIVVCGPHPGMIHCGYRNGCWFAHIGGYCDGTSVTAVQLVEEEQSPKAIARPPSPWVHVESSERPGDGEYTLVSYDDEQPAVAWYSGSDDRWFEARGDSADGEVPFNGAITHWMRLPDMPQDEGRGFQPIAHDTCELCGAVVTDLSPIATYSCGGCQKIVCDNCCKPTAHDVECAECEKKRADPTIIRAAEGVTLEPGEYEVVEVHAGDWAPTLTPGKRFTVDSCPLTAIVCLGVVGVAWCKDATYITAVRRIESSEPREREIVPPVGSEWMRENSFDGHELAKVEGVERVGRFTMVDWSSPSGACGRAGAEEFGAGKRFSPVAPVGETGERQAGIRSDAEHAWVMADGLLETMAHQNKMFRSCIEQRNNAISEVERLTKERDDAKAAEEQADLDLVELNGKYDTLLKELSGMRAEALALVEGAQRERDAT